MGFLSSIFGGGGGGSSSSSATTTTTNSSANVTIGSEDGGVSINSDSSTVNMLDEGAIEKAMMLAQVNYKDTVESFKGVVGLADKMFTGAKGTVDLASKTVSDGFKAANQTGTPLDPNKAIIAVAVVGGLYFLVSVRSKKQ